MSLQCAGCLHSTVSRITVRPKQVTEGQSAPAESEHAAASEIATLLAVKVSMSMLGQERSNLEEADLEECSQAGLQAGLQAAGCRYISTTRRPTHYDAGRILDNTPNSCEA